MTWIYKAQSALEYLTTYGWALLVIAMVITLIYVLGLINPQASFTIICNFPTNFNCVGGVLSTNGNFLFNLQSLGSGTSVNAIACNSNPSFANAKGFYPSLPIPQAKNVSLPITCYSNTSVYSGQIGALYAGYIAINYTDAQGLPHTVIGRLLAKATTNGALTTSTLVTTTSTTSTSTSTTSTSTSTTSTTIISGLLGLPTITPINSLSLAGGASTRMVATIQGGSGISPYTYNFFVVNTVTGAVVLNQVNTGVSTTSNTISFLAPSSLVGSTLVANVIVTDSALEQTNSIKSAVITIINIPTLSIQYNPTTYSASDIVSATAYNSADSIQIWINGVSAASGTGSTSLNVNTYAAGSYTVYAYESDGYNSLYNTLTINRATPLLFISSTCPSPFTYPQYSTCSTSTTLGSTNYALPLYMNLNSNPVSGSPQTAFSISAYLSNYPQPSTYTYTASTPGDGNYYSASATPFALTVSQPTCNAVPGWCNPSFTPSPISNCYQASLASCSAAGGPACNYFCPAGSIYTCNSLQSWCNPSTPGQSSYCEATSAASCSSGAGGPACNYYCPTLNTCNSLQSWCNPGTAGQSTYCEPTSAASCDYYGTSSAACNYFCPPPIPNCNACGPGPGCNTYCEPVYGCSSTTGYTSYHC